VSVGRILTQGLGTPFGGVQFLVTLGFGTSGTPPLPDGIAIGGDGYERPRRKKRRPGINELVTKWVDDILIPPVEMPTASPELAAIEKQVRAKASKYVVPDRGVDMEALFADARRAAVFARLYENYRRLIEEEDEEETIIALLLDS
jgi:hypothetical protein